LEKARAIDPNHYVNSYDLALACLQSARYAESRAVVTGLIEKSDRAELHNLLGELEAAEQHVEAAAKQYELAARMDPSEKNLFDLGSFLQSHRGFDQARIVFGYAAGKYPTAAKFQVGLGVAYYSLGQYDEAVQALCRAVDIDPKDTKALDFLGKMYDISPQYANEVTARLAGFVKTYPDNAAANFYYGLSLRKRNLGGGETGRQDAGRYLKRAVELNPKWADARFELGLYYEDARRTDDAVSQYEAAITLDPSNAKTHYRLANLYRETGRTDLAASELRKFEALRQPTH
jgi:tetratricopeptide (TPR) repeat protein